MPCRLLLRKLAYAVYVGLGTWLTVSKGLLADICVADSDFILVITGWAWFILRMQERAAASVPWTKSITAASRR